MIHSLTPIRHAIPNHKRVGGPWSWFWAKACNVWVFNNDSMHRVNDQVTGEAAQYSGTTPNYPRYASLRGIGAEGGSNSGFISFNNPPINGSQPRTSMVVGGKIAGTPAGYWFEYGRGGVTGQGWRMRLDANSPRVENQGGFAIANLTLSDKEVYAICCTLDHGDTNINAVKWVINGVEYSSSSTGSRNTNTTYSNANDNYLFSRASTSRLASNQFALMVVHFSDALTVDQAKRLTVEPFAPLYPRRVVAAPVSLGNVPSNPFLGPFTGPFSGSVI